MVRSTDLIKMDFESDVKYVSETAYNFLGKSKIYGGELLINKIGNPGNVYLMPSLDRPVTLGMNLFMIRLKAESLLNNYFLYIYFNSTVGQNIIYRNVNGTVPLTIDKEAVKNLPIPIFSTTFQQSIEDFVKSSHQKLEESKKLYSEAEALLLSELDLNDFTPSDESIAVKSFSESFGMSGRFDAEYYQPKYEDVKNKIEIYPNGYKPLSEICRLHDTNFTPNDNERYKYIELSNIGGNGEIKDCMNEYGSELPTRARRKVKNGQLIVSSIEGSLPSIAIVNSEYDGALCSTGFYVISSEQINSETLLMLLKNEMMQLLLKKGCSGTILTAIGKDEFQSILLPLIDENVQKAIADKIAECFTLRTESKRLLEEAKATVEQAIEQGETL